MLHDKKYRQGKIRYLGEEIEIVELDSKFLVYFHKKLYNVWNSRNEALIAASKLFAYEREQINKRIFSSVSVVSLPH